MRFSISSSKVIASNLGVGLRRFMLDDYGLEAAGTAPIFYFTHIKSAELKNLTFVKNNHFWIGRGGWFYYWSGDFAGINEFTEENVMFCIWMTIILFSQIEVSTSKGQWRCKLELEIGCLHAPPSSHFTLFLHTTM